MVRILLAALLIISPIAIEGWSRSAEAQTTATTTGSFLETIRQSVVQRTGAPDAAIKIGVVGSIIVVKRISAGAEATTHESRTSEAMMIASIVAAGVSDTKSYAKIISINVNYFRQHGTSVSTRPFDKLEFRRSQTGVFEIHLT